MELEFWKNLQYQITVEIELTLNEKLVKVVVCSAVPPNGSNLTSLKLSDDANLIEVSSSQAAPFTTRPHTQRTRNGPFGLPDLILCPFGTQAVWPMQYTYDALMHAYRMYRQFYITFPGVIPVG